MRAKKNQYQLTLIYSITLTYVNKEGDYLNHLIIKQNVEITEAEIPIFKQLDIDVID